MLERKYHTDDNHDILTIYIPAERYRLTDYWKCIQNSQESLVEHIKADQAIPIRQHSYRTRLALQIQLREELDKMLKLGVAQPSTSLLALYVVLVTRKMEEFTSVWTILSKTKSQNSMPYAKDIHETIGPVKVQLYS